MSVGLISVQDTDEISAVIDKMVKQKVHHVIVKNYEKTIVGLVTALDVAKGLIKEKGEEKSSFFSLLSVHK